MLVTLVIVVVVIVVVSSLSTSGKEDIKTENFFDLHHCHKCA